MWTSEFSRSSGTDASNRVTAKITSFVSLINIFIIHIAVISENVSSEAEGEMPSF